MVDPRASEYPWQTTYAYHRNSPISRIDYLGGGDKLNREEQFVILYWVSKYGVFDGYEMAQKVKWAAGIAREVSKKEGINVNGANDGESDAMRHSLWNALMASQFGAEDALKFTTAHEDGSEPNDPNSKYYDPVAVLMDRYNNVVGARIGEKMKEENPNVTLQQITDAIDQARKDGKFMVIKFADFTVKMLDEKGEVVLDADGYPILESISVQVNSSGQPIVGSTKRDLKKKKRLEDSGYTVDTDTSNKQLIRSGDLQNTTLTTNKAEYED